ncbi:armadillo-type protein, partial [Thamnocephalis sphaerospora]
SGPQGDSHGYNLRHRRESYKQTTIPRTAAAARAQRVARDQKIRQQQREQLILGKRFRHRKLSQDGDEHLDSDIDESETNQLRSDLKDDRRSTRIQALKRLSKCLTEPSSAIKHYVVQGDCVRQLTAFLTSTDAEEQLQALWCITNIAAGPREFCRGVFDTAPYLISFLSNEDKKLSNQSAWALGNIALEGDDARALLHANGIVVPLVNLLDTNDDELLQTACFALSSMLHGKDPRPQEFVAAGIIPKLYNKLERCQDNKTVAEVCWVVAYLAHCGDDLCRQLLDAGFAHIMTYQAGRLYNDVPLILPLVRALGNISAGPDEYTAQFVAEKGFIDLLAGLLQCESRPVRKETLWLFSNLTAGQDAQVEQLVNAGLLEKLCGIFLHDNFDLRKEAVYSLMNIARRGERFFNLLPFDAILPGFLDFLRSQDEEMLRIGLAFVQLALDHVPLAQSKLEQAGAPDALDSAMLNQDEELHHVAGHLLDQIFDESSSTVPSVDAEGSRFNVVDAL